jgi:hypothetical protein
VHRLLDEPLRCTQLDHAPEIHDAYSPVPGEVLGDSQVVRDEEEGYPEVPLQTQQHVEQPDTQRHVNHRDRLVGDDDLGIDRERPRDGNSLPLSPRELVTMLSQEILRRRQAHRLEKLVQPGLQLGTRLYELVTLQWCAQDLGHVANRVQRSVWVLVDDLDRPAEALLFLVRERADLRAAVEHTALGGFEQARHHASRRGLATPALADQAQGLSRSDRKRHVVHGPHLLAARAVEAAHVFKLY